MVPGAYHSQARVYRDVLVQVSNDATFKTGVTTVYNNDHDNSSKLTAGKDKEYIEVAEGRLFDPKGATGRSVRLYSNGNTTNDLDFLAVFCGRPAVEFVLGARVMLLCFGLQ